MSEIENITTENITDTILKYVQQLFYPLHVEIHIISNQINIEELSFMITASTGYLSASYIITYPLIKHSVNVENMVKFVKKKLHHELYKKIIEDFLSESESFNGGTKNVIVSTSIPKDKKITILHPEMYKDILLSEDMVRDLKPHEISWKKRIEK